MWALWALLSLGGLSCSRPVDNRIQLRIATWSGAGEDNEYFRLVNDIYHDFEKANPDIHIVIENMPGSEYVPKMMLSHIAKATPDVVIWMLLRPPCL
jgi:ABC-type glycerol-3-phosphate transport system substrate-binding protein